MSWIQSSWEVKVLESYELYDLGDLAIHVCHWLQRARPVYQLPVSVKHNRLYKLHGQQMIEDMRRVEHGFYSDSLSSVRIYVLILK